jgi:predicted MarR family transcription regulator
MFANKALMSMISKGDYPETLETIFKKYNVDQTKMLRYARRRNRKDELVNYIKEHTNIKLLGED